MKRSAKKALRKIVERAAFMLEEGKAALEATLEKSPHEAYREFKSLVGVALKEKIIKRAEALRYYRLLRRIAHA